MEYHLVQFCCHGRDNPQESDIVYAAESGNHAIFKFAGDYLRNSGQEGCPKWLEPDEYDSAINYRRRCKEYLQQHSKTINAEYINNAGFIRTCVVEEYSKAHTAMLVHVHIRKTTVVGYSSVPVTLGEYVQAFNSLRMHEAIAVTMKLAHTRMPSLFKQNVDLLDAIEEARSPMEAAHFLMYKVILGGNVTVSIKVFIRKSRNNAEFVKLPTTAVIGAYLPLPQTEQKNETPMFYFITAERDGEDLGVNHLITEASPEAALSVYAWTDEKLKKPYTTEVTKVWGATSTSSAMMVCIIRAFIVTDEGNVVRVIGHAAEDLNIRRLVENAYKGLKEECPEALSCEADDLSYILGNYWSLGQLNNAFLTEMAPPGSMFSTKVYIRTDVDGAYYELPKAVAFDAYTPNMRKEPASSTESSYYKPRSMYLSGIPTSRSDATVPTSGIN